MSEQSRPDHVRRLFHELAAVCMAAPMVRYARSLLPSDEEIKHLPPYRVRWLIESSGYHDAVAEVARCVGQHVPLFRVFVLKEAKGDE